MCDHRVYFWETRSYEDWNGDIQEDQVYESEMTYEDMDLHRYRCTQCGQIFYYSQAAKEYYEDGIKTNIQGLDK